jgi:hypothetical protein
MNSEIILEVAAKTLSGAMRHSVWKFSFGLAFCLAAAIAAADDITTVDGQKYENVRDVSLKPNGLFFVVGDGADMHGVTVELTNLPPDIQDKYHCDGYSLGMLVARQNQEVYLSKSMAFSLDQLDAAKKKARDEKKLVGFIMVWDDFYTPSHPVGRGSNGALAHFFDVFHNNLVLVFVSHERELGSVPDAVRQGFGGPEEGGYAPNMAVVNADCSKFVCEIPYAGKDFAGREEIFRQKIGVIKKFVADNGKN